MSAMLAFLHQGVVGDERGLLSRMGCQSKATGKELIASHSITLLMHSRNATVQPYAVQAYGSVHVRSKTTLKDVLVSAQLVLAAIK